MRMQHIECDRCGEVLIEGREWTLSMLTTRIPEDPRECPPSISEKRDLCYPCRTLILDAIDNDRLIIGEEDAARVDLLLRTKP